MQMQPTSPQGKYKASLEEPAGPALMAPVPQVMVNVSNSNVNTNSNVNKNVNKNGGRYGCRFCPCCDCCCTCLLSCMLDSCCCSCTCGCCGLKYCLIACCLTPK